MYGRFTTTQLQRFAKDQAAKLRSSPREESEAKKTRRTTDKESDDEFRSYEDSRFGEIKRELKSLKQITVKRTISGASYCFAEQLQNAGPILKALFFWLAGSAARQSRKLYKRSGSAARRLVSQGSCIKEVARRLGGSSVKEVM